MKLHLLSTAATCLMFSPQRGVHAQHGNGECIISEAIMICVEVMVLGAEDTLRCSRAVCRRSSTHTYNSIRLSRQEVGSPTVLLRGEERESTVV